MDKVAIVTGAASGIGLACARLLAARGAKAAMVDIDARNRVRNAAQIEAFFLETDVSSEESVTASVKEVVDHFGRLDILSTVPPSRSWARYSKPRAKVGSVFIRST
jgi:NAD(P)-dependent dehydrogenase (short-subunit alcohol dehydrogenase family)